MTTSAPPALGRESGVWQPIETAPLDDLIQLWRCGKWDAGQFNHDKYALKPKPYWASYARSWNGVRWMRDNLPTHWLPLPGGPDGAR